MLESHLLDPRSPLALRCAIIPAVLATQRNLPDVRGELAAIVQLAHTTRRPRGAPGGLIPKTAGTRQPDPLANLWFIRAAQLFAGLARDPLDVVFATDVLLPLRKQIIQQFVGTGVGAVRMDDGGLLAGKSRHAGLRINALWYSALETTAAALRSAPPGALRDPSAEHFERLAGRFRRSFAKAFWCDEHTRICAPESRAAPEHGKVPDAEQLLLATLPASPLPHTKQRQLVNNVAARAQGAVGLLIDHGFHGPVESPLHRAWLVEAILAIGDSDAPAVAARQAAPLLPLRDLAAGAGVCPLYRNGAPLPRQKPDLFTSAEILAALALANPTPLSAAPATPPALIVQ